MDAETWGGETVVVTCPACHQQVFKAKTQRQSEVSCPCGAFIVRSTGYTISCTYTPPPSNEQFIIVPQIMMRPEEGDGFYETRLERGHS